MIAVMNATPIIRLLGPGDAAVLSDVAEDVFDNEINPRWTAEFLGDSRHHMVVAIPIPGQKCERLRLRRSQAFGAPVQQLLFLWHSGRPAAGAPN